MKRKLLVVDDEIGFADYVQAVALDMGFEVATLTDSRRFEETFDAFTPDMIVLDIVMPEVDGIEIVRLLARKGSRTRILLVSGYTPNYATAAQAIAEASGVFKVERLNKPTPLIELRQALAP